MFRQWEPDTDGRAPLEDTDRPAGGAILMSASVSPMGPSRSGTPVHGAPAALTGVVTPAREITLRALIVGCLIGAILAAGNVYTGLKTSFIDGGSITAALLGFAFFATFKRFARSPYSALETNITQTTAASAAIMGFVLGVAGPIPALALMGHVYPAWALIVWGIALGVIGIFIAASLRRKLIVTDALPFPTGAATAEVIETIASARTVALNRARLLLVSALAAAVLTWFRDGRPALIPQVTSFGSGLGGMSMAALTLGISWSPLMVSTGVLMGTRSAFSMLLGGLCTWGIVAPWLVRAGIVPTPGYGTCIPWLVWPGLGLLTASSFVPLVVNWRAALRGFRDLPSLLRPAAARNGLRGEPSSEQPIRFRIPILIAALVAVMGVGWLALGLSPIIIVIALILAIVFAGVTARAAGETDLAPIGAIGMLTQLVFAGQGPAVSLLSASISGGEASQTSQTLWALKAGYCLKASPRAQIWAQILGAVVGGLVVVPIYLVIVKSHGIGTEALPAPGAVSWKATAEAVRGGIAGMPRYGPLAGGIGFALGVVLAALERTRFHKVVPSPTAIGVAMLMPAYLSTAAFLGGLIVAVVRRLRPDASALSIMSFAAGGIAGESLMAVIIAALIAAGVL